MNNQHNALEIASVSKKCDREDCERPAYESSPFCKGHGGARGSQLATRRAVTIYEKTKLGPEITAALPESTKDLHGELVVSRVLLARLLNGFTHASDLIALSGPIEGMITKIQSIVQTIHKIEKDSAGYLTQDQVIRLASLLLEAVEMELRDLPDAHLRLARLGETFTKAIKDTTINENTEFDSD